MGVRFGTPAAALVLGCLLVLLTACGGPGRVSRDGTTCTGQLTGPGPVYLTAWFHTGPPAEAATMRHQVAAFNAAQRQAQVRLTEIPAAWRFLSYLLQTSQVLRLARASGGIPATRAAIRQEPAFAPGGPDHLSVQQLEDGIARARPQTPAYPAITAAFSTAFLDIAQGGSVRRALDTAAGQIDRNLAAHRYHQPSEP